MKSRIFLAAICFFFLTASMSFGYKATFLPRLSVNEDYTDNVLLTGQNDLKEDDYITTISPNFIAELIGKKGQATVQYHPSYAFYKNYDTFNGWRHRAILSANYNTGKNTSIDVRDNFLYTEDPIRDVNIAEIRTEDPTQPIDFTNRKTRRIFTRNFARVNIDHQFGEYHSFRVGYTDGLLNNDDPSYQDKKRHTPSVGLTYWFGPKWGFEVNGAYTRGEFERSNDIDIYQGDVSLLKRFGKHFLGYIRYSHEVVKYSGDSGEDTTYNPSIGISYEIEKDISLKLDIGYFYNDFASRESQSNVNGYLRLVKLFEHGKLNFAVLGGYDYSLFGTEDLGFAVYYEPSVSGTYQLAKHVHGNIFVAYRNTEYKDISNRKDKIPIAGVGVTWQPLEWMNVGLNYRYQRVDSTVSAAEYDESRASVRITVFPKTPFHTSRY